MPTPLTIEKLTVIATTGANRRPCSGDVQFSDGKFYGWSTIATEGVRFTGSRRRHATWERFAFEAPTRAQLVLDYLNSDACPAPTVFKVSLGG